jgi:dihydroorotate dehydrogenase (NAD+) catalytic subunit
MDLSVSIGSLRLPNPLIAASGCFGYGVEYSDIVDLSTLGGVAVKGLFLAERQGHPLPRIVETPSGMLNAIGLPSCAIAAPSSSSTSAGRPSMSTSSSRES